MTLHDPCLFVGCPDPTGEWDSSCHIFDPLQRLGKWNHPLQTGKPQPITDDPRNAPARVPP